MASKHRKSKQNALDFPGSSQKSNSVAENDGDFGGVKTQLFFNG
jgi:hypothetical protein